MFYFKGNQKHKTYVFSRQRRQEAKNHKVGVTLKHPISYFSENKIYKTYVHSKQRIQGAKNDKLLLENYRI